jgi:biotin carboxyl carrier protein
MFLLATLLIESCTHKKAAGDEEETKVDARTPVTITSVSNGLMSDSIALNAVTAFQKKNTLKSSATGYVVKVNAAIGDYVEQGQVLFTIKTKEASAYTSKALDSILNFTGKFDIKASSSGIISELDKHEDDYVADGDQLCIIAQKSSLVFILNVPFEFNQSVHTGQACTIELPDKTTLPGVVDSRLSAMDPVAQTESFVVRASTERNLPENLIARIRILKTVKRNASVLPKEAVLTDETEENYWVMKLINDSTAVKVPVVKGLETKNTVEILSPAFSSADRIILTGNYGLPDTALVQIQKPAAHE